MHALSRCQMILTEAKRRAQSEFENVMAKLGVNVEDVRRCEAAHPEIKRASYRVPHMGYAGTAANYVTHLAVTGKIKSRGVAAPVSAAAMVL